MSNQIRQYTRSLLTNEAERYDTAWLQKLKLLETGSIYYPNHFEKTDQCEIFTALKKELEASKCETVQWSRHYKIGNPTFLPTFNKIIERLAKLFDVEIAETRLNYYPNQESWKPFHHDRTTDDETSNIKENFTMGASFGATRSLAFIDVETERTFSIPQNNGDIFAFTAAVNKIFQHGVPKTNAVKGERFSIIAWGYENKNREKQIVKKVVEKGRNENSKGKKRNQRLRFL